MSNAVIEGTGGEVISTNFSEDLDAEQLAIEYQGEYDESGKFIMDEELEAEKRSKGKGGAPAPVAPVAETAAPTEEANA
jgi:small subunit ribosomal protein S2